MISPDPMMMEREGTCMVGGRHYCPWSASASGVIVILAQTHTTSTHWAWERISSYYPITPSSITLQIISCDIYHFGK